MRLLVSFSPILLLFGHLAAEAEVKPDGTLTGFWRKFESQPAGDDELPFPGQGQSRAKRAAPLVLSGTAMWPKKGQTVPIYYNFSQAAGYKESFKALIRRKLAEYTANTCIDIEENTEGKAQIQFATTTGGCSSHNGYGGPHLRNIEMPAWCDYGIQHEFMHALGFGHTQRRTDRDKYITINYANLDGGKNNTNFIPYYKGDMREDLGVPYDFASIVHYPSNSMALDESKNTMIPYDSGYEMTMASSHSPAFSDYKQINVMYKCGEHCPEIKCENGGYRHPRICGKCVCHDFARGDRCQVLPALHMTERPGDYEKYEMNNDGKLYDVVFDQHDFSTYDKMTRISFMAPLGKKLFVNITEFDMSDENFKAACKDRCWLASLEFVDNERGDLTMGGKRYCCKDKGKGFSFVTRSNILGFRGHVRKGWKYNLKYTVQVHEPRGNLTWQPEPVWELPPGN